MKRLKICVERAVRPVRALDGRKDAMREELLAHLTAIYREELEATGDEAAAVEAAMRRFGQPAELTGELEASVPRMERVLSRPIRWLGFLDLTNRLVYGLRKEDKSPGVRGVRLSAMFLLVLAVPLTIVLGASSIILDRTQQHLMPADLRILCGAVMMTVLAAVSLVFPSSATGLFGVLLDKSRSGGSWLRPVLPGAAVSLVLLAAGLLLLLIIQPYRAFEPVQTCAVVLAALSGPPAMGLMSRAFTRDLRRFKEWGQLQIQECH